MKTDGGSSSEAYAKFLNRGPNNTGFMFQDITPADGATFNIPKVVLLTFPELIATLDAPGPAPLCATVVFLTKAYPAIHTNGNTLLRKFDVMVPTVVHPSGDNDFEAMELAFFGDAFEPSITWATSELNAQFPTIPIWQLQDFQMRKYSINGKDTLSLNATTSSTIDGNSDADLFSIMKGLIV